MSRERIYQEYLRSETWKAKRRAALAHYGHACCRCGAAAELLQVHHRNYNRPLGEETMEDLEILCEPCHRTEHGMRQLPDPIRREQINGARRAYWKRNKAARHAKCQAAWASACGASA